MASCCTWTYLVFPFPLLSCFHCLGSLLPIECSLSFFSSISSQLSSEATLAKGSSISALPLLSHPVFFSFVALTTSHNYSFKDLHMWHRHLSPRWVYSLPEKCGLAYNWSQRKCVQMRLQMTFHFVLGVFPEAHSLLIFLLLFIPFYSDTLPFAPNWEDLWQLMFKLRLTCF